MSWVRLEMLRLCISNLFLLLTGSNSNVASAEGEGMASNVFGNRQLLLGTKYGCY